MGCLSRRWPRPGAVAAGVIGAESGHAVGVVGELHLAPAGSEAFREGARGLQHAAGRPVAADILVPDNQVAVRREGHPGRTTCRRPVLVADEGFARIGVRAGKPQQSAVLLVHGASTGNIATDHGRTGDADLQGGAGVHVHRARAHVVAIGQVDRRADHRGGGVIAVGGGQIQLAAVDGQGVCADDRGVQGNAVDAGVDRTVGQQRYRLAQGYAAAAVLPRTAAQVDRVGDVVAVQIESAAVGGDGGIVRGPELAITSEPALMVVDPL